MSHVGSLGEKKDVGLVRTNVMSVDIRTAFEQRDELILQGDKLFKDRRVVSLELQHQLVAHLDSRVV